MTIYLFAFCGSHWYFCVEKRILPPVNTQSSPFVLVDQFSFPKKHPCRTESSTRENWKTSEIATKWLASPKYFHAIVFSDHSHELTTNLKSIWQVIVSWHAIQSYPLAFFVMVSAKFKDSLTVYVFHLKGSWHWIQMFEMLPPLIQILGCRRILEVLTGNFNPNYTNVVIPLRESRWNKPGSIRGQVCRHSHTTVLLIG